MAGEMIEVVIRKVFPGPELRGVIVTVENETDGGSFTFWEPQGTPKEWRERIGTTMTMQRKDESSDAELAHRGRLFVEGRFDELADEVMNQ